MTSSVVYQSPLQKVENTTGKWIVHLQSLFEIKSLQDFATCADWELAGGYTTVEGKRVRDEGLLEQFELSITEAQQLIMRAREMLGWITKEESEEIIKSLNK